MIASHLIAKHKNAPEGAIDSDASCTLCGAVGIAGYPETEVIPKNWPNSGSVSGTGHVCWYCAVCAGYKQTRKETLRNFSYIATPEVLRILSRVELWEAITSRYDREYVIAITYSRKKYCFLHCEANPPDMDRRVVGTENLSVVLHPERDSELLDVIQRWYTVCKDTAQQPTWFTKAQILQGCNDPWRIEQYGMKKYMIENMMIERRRRTAALELYVHCLNKKGENELSQDQEGDGDKAYPGGLP